MMAHKHLHELLKEDQEPFLLKSYIDDRRSLLKRPVPKTTLQPKRRRSVLDGSSSKRSLCKQACFFSFQDSPDVRKSPFVDFRWPATEKSPCRSPNGLLLHIPAKTASLLLEAATRIQKQPSSSKPKNQIKNVGFGLFGSILKRLSGKKRSPKSEIRGGGVVRKSGGKTKKVPENVAVVDEKSPFEMGFARSCSHSRRNSAFWSESNEGKSLDLETSASSQEDDDSTAVEERENGNHFCYSPPSPFRFSLQRSPSHGSRTPDFTSPATSPTRHHKQENCEPQKIKLEVEEEEEKEQCSPVSVLDPPFDDDGHGDGVDEDGYDIECSYTVVQRAKQQLLQKLLRFEKLAELDPIELEKVMLDEEDEEEEEEEEEGEIGDLKEEDECEGFAREVLNRSGLCFSKVSADMKRLVLDLIAEEEKEDGGIDDSEMVKRVCERLDSWKEVEPNTIDMMVELDFRREVDGWKRNDQEEVRKTGIEIEIGIFGLLVEELSEELLCLSDF